MAHPWHDIALPPDDALEVFPVVAEVVDSGTVLRPEGTAHAQLLAEHPQLER